MNPWVSWCHFTLTLAAWGDCSWADHLCWRHSGHSDTSYQWHRPFRHTSMSSLWRSWRPVKGNRWEKCNYLLEHVLAVHLCLPHHHLPSSSPSPFPPVSSALSDFPHNKNTFLWEIPLIEYGYWSPTSLNKYELDKIAKPWNQFHKGEYYTFVHAEWPFNSHLSQLPEGRNVSAAATSFKCDIIDALWLLWWRCESSVTPHLPQSMCFVCKIC